MNAKAAWFVGGLVAVVVAIALVVRGLEERWGAETCLGVAALYVSLGGFAIAIAEIHRAATVSEATEQAIKHTLKVVAAGHLAITITHLRHTVDDLEQATDARDSVGARRAINAWRNLASEARGPLRKQFPKDATVIPALDRSIELGQHVKGKLSEAENEPLRPITGECLAAMEQVSNDLAALIDELTPTIQEDG
jgi:hypothetical protein